MDISFFLTFRHPERPATRIGKAELTRLGEIVKPVAGLRKALAFTPGATEDPYLNDGPPPLLALQLYFADIAALEAALIAGGSLDTLTDLPSLAGAEATQQAMLTRIFPVAEPRAAASPCCTYLVAYEGVAEDRPGWLSHYIAHHPPLMARLPGIRELEIYTRIDWCGALLARRAGHLQRNKVVFDDEAALRAALNSPIRHRMRADFENFPRHDGPVTHFPMVTRRLLP